MLGDGPEQFIIRTSVDGKLVKAQRIHDPFVHSRTVVGISRWDLFKAIFCRQFTITVQISLEGSPAVQRAIMSLDVQSLEAENEEIASKAHVTFPSDSFSLLAEGH